MRDRTDFEAKAERLIVDRTNELLRALDGLALKMGVGQDAVEVACERFSGGDLADCWFDYLVEAEG